MLLINHFAEHWLEVCQLSVVLTSLNPCTSLRNRTWHVALFSLATQKLGTQFQGAGCAPLVVRIDLL